MTGLETFHQEWFSEAYKLNPVMEKEHYMKVVKTACIGLAEFYLTVILK